MGKHRRILLVDAGEVPQATADYLEMVRPDPTAPNRTSLNFACIVGDLDRVSWEVQQEVTRLLAPGGRAAASDATDEEN